jgi:chemotaxis protein MotA
MYLSTLGGFFLLVAGLEMALAAEGDSLAAMINTPAAELIIVCGLGAALLSAPGGRVLALPWTIAKVLWPSRYRPAKAAGLVESCMQLADQVQRSGPLALTTAHGQADPFLLRGLSLLRAEMDGKTFAALLHAEIDAMEGRHQETYHLIASLGPVAAGAGAVGTLLGTIVTLGHLEDTSKLGPSIATALLSAFYGIILSTLVMVPLSAKLKQRSQQEAALKRMLVDGLIAIQQGESPAQVRERMTAGFSERQRSRIARRLSSSLAG